MADDHLSVGERDVAMMPDAVGPVRAFGEGSGVGGDRGCGWVVGGVGCSTNRPGTGWEPIDRVCTIPVASHCDLHGCDRWR